MVNILFLLQIKISTNIKKSYLIKNFFATNEIQYLKNAEIVISSIGLDFFNNKNSSLLNFKNQFQVLQD